MIIKTRGIVFKSIKYGETSLIVDIYTEEKGLQKYMIHGVRSRKAKTKASLLQVLSIVDLVAFARENKELNRVKEVRSAHIFQSIPFNIIKGAIGLFIAEVARKTIKEREENKALFQFLLETILFLDQTEQAVNNIHLSFLLGLSNFLGIVPSGDYSKEAPIFDMQEGVFVSEQKTHLHYLEEHFSFLMYQLLRFPMEESHQVRISNTERRRLLKKLLDYYHLHIDNMPTINAHLVLQEVLE